MLVRLTKLIAVQGHCKTEDCMHESAHPRAVGAVVVSPRFSVESANRTTCPTAQRPGCPIFGAVSSRLKPALSEVEGVGNLEPQQCRPSPHRPGCPIFAAALSRLRWETSNPGNAAANSLTCYVRAADANSPNRNPPILQPPQPSVPHPSAASSRMGGKPRTQLCHPSPADLGAPSSAQFHRA